MNLGGRSSAWLEHQIVALRAAGSNPVDHPEFILLWILFLKRGLGFAPVAQLDRAFASGAKGRRFESCQAHFLTNFDNTRFLLG